MKKIIFVAMTIIGLLVVIFSSLGITQELSDSDTVDAMLPPCTVEDGLPFVGEDDVTCYWGMSGEVLEIPSEAIAADVDVVHCWMSGSVGSSGYTKLSLYCKYVTGCLSYNTDLHPL